MMKRKNIIDEEREPGIPLNQDFYEAGNTTNEEEFVELESTTDSSHEGTIGNYKTNNNHHQGSSQDLFEGIEEDSREDFWLPFLGGFSGDGASRASISHLILRWPLMLIILAFINVDLVCYLTTRYFVSFYEYYFTWTGTRRVLRRKLKSATTYDEFIDKAETLDKYLGNENWKAVDRCDYYDYKLISRLEKKLKGARMGLVDHSDKGIENIIRILKHSCLKSNPGGIENEALYSHSYIGTKHIVEDYLNEVVESLKTVGESNLSVEKKEIFFRSALRQFGRTALCLSGGGTLGYYHIGVVKALFYSNMLPRVISGSSSGSLIGSLVCTRTDQELVDQLFNPDIYKTLNCMDGSWMHWKNIKRLLTEGVLFSKEEWIEKTSDATFGLTFLEAYQKTGRILNITVVPYEQYSCFKMLNYITAPDVLIASAVLASSAIPSILKPVTLLQKREDGKIVPFLGLGVKWRDGSLRADIPERELHQLFDVNYTIVSQTNPHILLFFYERMGSAGNPVTHKRGKGWRGGFLSSLITQHFKLDMQKWLHLLRDLSLLPRYRATDFTDVFTQKYEGNCTITPPATFLDYAHIISDPSREDMQRYIDGGQNYAFPKLGMLKDRLMVEKCLRSYHRFFLLSKKKRDLDKDVNSVYD